MAHLPSHIPIEQAAAKSPVLEGLFAQARESRLRWTSVSDLIPQDLRASVRPSVVADNDWCLLVGSSAAAAKMRQLLPVLQERLASRGWHAATIRLKVSMRVDG